MSFRLARLLSWKARPGRLNSVRIAALGHPLGFAT